MKKTILFLTTVLLLIIGLLGCVEGESSDQKQANATERNLSELNRQVGMPNIANYQQKKLMKMIFELCDKEKLICHAYLKSDYTGKLIYLGKCMGFGIPFSAQYTSPQKLVNRYGNTIKSTRYEPHIMPQADPNGLFMPTSSSATWLMMINPKTNKPQPVYIEPEIVVSPFPLM